MGVKQDPEHPTGVSETNDQRKGVARARDRKANSAIQLRMAGATWDEIAEVLGFPSGKYAIIAVERALEKELKSEENQKAMRSMAGRRLDRLLRSVWSKAIDEKHPEHLLAVDKARQLIDRHIKLYGLDAPTEFVVSNPSQTQLEQWVATVMKEASPQLEEGDIFDVDYEDEIKAIGE